MKKMVVHFSRLSSKRAVKLAAGGWWLTADG